MMKSFGEGFSTVAEKWNGNENLEVTTKLHSPYIAAAHYILEKIYQESSDTRLTSLSSGQQAGIEHGTKVIMRYYNHAMSSANQQQIGYQTAIDYLRSDEGITPLSNIASQPNAVALHLEGALCIGQDSVCTLEAPEPLTYEWNSGKLIHPSLFYQTMQLRLDYEDQENTPIDPTQICRAEKTRHLAPISFALLDICAKDERLFASTYATGVST